VAGEERHPALAHRADRDRRRRGPVGGVELDLLDVVEQGVEAGAAVDPDVRLRTAPPSGGCHAVLAGVLLLDESPLDDEVDDDPSDEEPLDALDSDDLPEEDDDPVDEDDLARLSFL
jgi:hypothetical protein